ncbi:hypothetical protein NUW58_g4584 [Xylaria curta]|uniref:Uncharacterized protein n=1 Tax=Xylaria curta TaxID=42375 RepID=A0ACC1P5X4_9PEZI|nr:hypothetical protein NUW58_g4584 [Xylaria curta]
MASDANANASRGSSDFDCNTPPTQDLFLIPNWDGVFEFQERIDPKTSLELLQEPIPYFCEPQDEWLTEFKRLQDVYNRAPVLSAPTVFAPPQLNGSGDALTTNTNTPSDTSSCQPESENPSKSLHHPHGPLPVTGQLPYVQSETVCAPPASTTYPPFESKDPAIHNWNSTPYNEQQAVSERDVKEAVKRLREMEQSLQADTKRRKSQIEQSCAG